MQNIILLSPDLKALRYLSMRRGTINPFNTNPKAKCSAYQTKFLPSSHLQECSTNPGKFLFARSNWRTGPVLQLPLKFKISAALNQSHKRQFLTSSLRQGSSSVVPKPCCCPPRSLCHSLGGSREKPVSKLHKSCLPHTTDAGGRDRNDR